MHKYEWDLLNKYSSLEKLLRVLAYVLRFVYSLLSRLKSKRLAESTTLLNCLDSYVKHKSQLHSDQTKRDEFLSKVRTQLEAQVQFKLLNLDSQSNCRTYDSSVVSPSELLRCEHVLTYLHHIEHFSKEMRILRTKGRLSKNHHLNKLRPYIDWELIRVGGRLENCLLPLENKHPSYYISMIS